MSEEYSLEFKADALILLNFNKGDIQITADILEIEPELLEQWKDKFEVYNDSLFEVENEIKLT